jgi:hypothetical protein
LQELYQSRHAGGIAHLDADSIGISTHFPAR